MNVEQVHTSAALLTLQYVFILNFGQIQIEQSQIQKFFVAGCFLGGGVVVT